MRLTSRTVRPARAARAARSARLARGTWLRRGAVALVAVLVLEYAVLPQLVDARAALDLLRNVAPSTLFVGVALEICSLLSYSALTRCVLPPVGRPAFGVLFRIDLSGLGVSHVVPGGGATAAGFRFRLLTHAGVEPRLALTGTAIQTGAAIGAVVVAFLAGVGLSLGQGHDDAGVRAAGMVALALVGLLAACGGALLGAPGWTRRGCRHIAGQVPRVDPRAVDRLVQVLSQRLRVQLGDRRLRAWTITWALANVGFDASALWTCLHAFGASEDLGPLLAAYGIANLLAFLPVTPGGLGIVEGVLVPALVSFGSPHAVALIGVLAWRLVEFWLPIPVSWLTYLSLRVGLFRDRDLTAPTHGVVGEIAPAAPSAAVSTGPR